MRSADNQTTATRVFLVHSSAQAIRPEGLGASARLACLVVRSTIALNLPAILNQLIGVEAAITLGNKAGDLGTP